MSTALMSAAPSGLAAVDRQWGGFDAGHTYLLVGRAGAGRSELALQIVQATVNAGSRCLLLSPRPPSELVEIGQGVGFDLAGAHEAGLLRPLRIPTAADLAVKGTEGLDTAYRDLVELVRAEEPTRVVVEDFTPLVQFDSFEGLQTAFSSLVASLRELDTALIVGLGAPANDASRRLLDIVRKASDGMVEIQDDGSLALDGSADAAAPAEPEPDAFAEEPEEIDAEPMDEAVEAEHDDAPAEDDPNPFASEALDIAPEADDADAEIADVDTQTDDAVAEMAAAPEADDDAPSAELATETVEMDAEAPAAEMPSAETPSAETPSAETPSAEAEAAPNEPATPPVEAAPAEAAPAEAALATEDQVDTSVFAAATSGDGTTSNAAIVPPPPVDPSLLEPSDAFASDPADALMDQGYIVDSGSRSGGDGARYTAAAGAAAFSAPSEGPDADFRRALASAFQTRSAGVPFLIVAARMQPGTPEAAYFPNVTAALGNALPPSAHILSNDARKRSIVLLPMAGPEAGQTLFADLQAGLRRTIGAEAEATLQAISAVTVPDGQPFSTPSDLMAYAFDG